MAWSSPPPFANQPCSAKQDLPPSGLSKTSSAGGPFALRLTTRMRAASVLRARHPVSPPSCVCFSRHLPALSGGRGVSAPVAVASCPPEKESRALSEARRSYQLLPLRRASVQLCPPGRGHAGAVLVHDTGPSHSLLLPLRSSVHKPLQGRLLH